MKLDRRPLLIGLGILLVIIFVIGRNGSRILPPGKLSTSEQLAFPSPAPSTPITGKPQVEVTTSRGIFTLELRPDISPKTVLNFLTKWANGYCNGKTFHRAEDWVVQGCDPAGDGTGGQTNLPTEFSAEQFSAGSLGVARKNTPRDFSNDSQFFILKKDAQFLDGEYTYFGRILSGMDVVNAISIGDTITSTQILTK